MALSPLFRTLFFFLVPSVFFRLAAQEQKTDFSPPADSLQTGYFNENYLRYENFVYRSNIKTVMLHKEGFDFSLPMLELNSGDKLKLSFDDLNGGAADYYYTFIHCNAEWQPSALLPYDYMEGFTDDHFTDYRFSFNTIQKYTHYSIVFPNETIRLSKSGNYIIKVYADNDHEQLVLTRRFMIFEQKVTVEADVHRATIINDRNAKQEVDFTILCNGYRIDNPFGDLKVVLLQNERWDNAVTILQPMLVKGDELIYNYEEGNVFNGGNEFRPFDFRSMRFYTERVKDIVYDSSHNHVYLFNDEKRSYLRYSTLPDVNGKYYIKTQEGRDNETEADYAFVHFQLVYDSPLADGNLYVFGALTDWNIAPENKMKYNYELSAYQCSLYLKQGYYNYMYMYAKDGEKNPDETFIEGNHYETENNYMIYVYHRSLGIRYDRLVGVANVKP